ncbi:hypothetical protein SELMODRAFT_163526 [Selaginella moellendorffii]|uniref:F-box domain-containing protein n=1 Tax=Selaginella moellendorffii TaxID=88036 RepID=D8QPC7_SELML|nr:coronatine-insensitive protein 1 [Selaginella moellendorffii]EFJ38256.1 hypothetical protein SELMODRAFT_163526 [Selaginella moellendorffii]|eukprot:XP_002960717.1 coronatine-insensitive protein 1 [Selaginella moellendorffii]
MGERSCCSRTRQRNSRDGDASIIDQVCEHPLLLESVLSIIFGMVDSPAERRAMSEVCRQWHAMDRETRKHVYVAFVYSVSPATLTRRFPNLRSLKLKAKPRAYEFDLLPHNWGGHVHPWLENIGPAYPQLSALHLRRMEVRDQDLSAVATAYAASLETLKLDFCSGFSTTGLRAITGSCKCLKVLYVENSYVSDEGGQWLNELALHNRVLEVLDFQLAIGISKVNVEDVRTIIEKCPNLTSLKLVEGEDGLGDGLRKALASSTSLRELGIFLTAQEEDDQEEIDQSTSSTGQQTMRALLPRNLTSISGDIPVPLYTSVAAQLLKLDLMTTTSIEAEQHHALLRCCTRLQNLQVRTVIGDEGLAIVGECCKDLRKVRIEDHNDEGTSVSHTGLMALARGCSKLEKLAIYVADMSNQALAAVGSGCPDLRDFRLILTEANDLSSMTELPLDAGFDELMRGCHRLSRLCIYVRPGALSDHGLVRIGHRGANLKALLLGCCGDSDAGFLAIARGCKRLQRLEIRDCPFTDDGLLRGVGCMEDLKLMWIQGFRMDDYGKLDVLGGEKYRNVECTRRDPIQCLIYRSLAGPRLDCPEEVVSPQGNGMLRHNWLTPSGGLVVG